MKKFVLSLSGLAMLLAIAGCSQETVEPTETASVDGSKFQLSSEPNGALNVIQAREDAEDGKDVVLMGRIGGGANPWIDGLAAFTIVDDSLRACSDIPGDSCKKPWDYCCETPKLPTSTALVKVVDEDGELVKADASELLGVKELSSVVVQGTAERDDDGNLTVLASGIFVKKK
ncbi:hypothetical protein [Thalassoroseus pseudoceratinae]|uniref:hypothetical protein n=1 Tax=Thalassoroseus pseudoceratinae TaxID=2713176 RepID=UPI00142076EF|nr:hypothetical protein [Thalassoroseus pseudoceratinae]